MSQNKFVSSIPNNKLEPVFLGGGDGSFSKSSGVYVPSFLRNKTDTDRTNTENPPAQKKEFKLADDDFPLISGNKVFSVATKSDTVASKIFTNYSDALKKDIDKPKPKSSKTHISDYEKKSHTKNSKQSILNNYNNYDSDEYFEDEEPF
jgi:hypothetical protein